jgi:hypothetical protein
MKPMDYGTDIFLTEDKPRNNKVKMQERNISNEGTHQTRFSEITRYENTNSVEKTHERRYTQFNRYNDERINNFPLKIGDSNFSIGKFWGALNEVSVHFGVL